ncbi:hypothetical protein [Chitinophaga agrisoli]|uniref:hypothetical protein n=1 Tax=Chitinophaga agrisoli TaxID=2607653 RepID=UPI001BCA2B67|nr:hypothetical protein [Chitinophaga agrisoli]
MEKKKRGAIKQPDVIGAVLQPGYCCDFLETKFIEVLTSYHKMMASQYQALDVRMPENRDLPHDRHNDRILRLLDCATIEFMHAEILNEVKKEVNKRGFSENKIFDSTRGAFIEGGPAFEGAGIFEKTHIQICIRNLNCIKGFFLPRKEIDYISWLEEANQGMKEVVL